MRQDLLCGKLHAAVIGFSLASLALSANASAQVQTKHQTVATAKPEVQNPFDAFQNFSALLSGGIIGDSDRKIYRSGKLMRTDFPDQYRITDMDVPVTWVVFNKKDAKAGSQSATCARFDVADASTYPFWGLKNFRVEHTASRETAVAKDSVDGHPCKIDHLTLVNPENSPTATMEMKLWEAEDLGGFPVKIEVHSISMNRTFTIRYTDVKLHPPDATLFVHPEECGAKSQKTPGSTKDAPDPIKPSTTAPPPANPPQ